MVGVVLREQPGFQLSLTQLVLFGCFWLQQKHRPFMSTVERAAVVADHKAKAEEGVTVHKRIAERIKGIEKSKAMYNRQKAVKNLDSYKASAGRKKVLEYFWDYNTVEAVLLACAILICLAGVMFESDRFADQADGQVSRHAWQRDIITYATIMLVFVSLIYYGTVFLSETGVLQVTCLIALFADKKKARHRRDEKKAMDGVDGEVNMSANPMMLKLQQNKETKKAEEQLAQMADAAAKLQQQLVKAKKNNHKNLNGTKGGRGKNKNKKKKMKMKTENKKSRRKFGAQQTDMMDGHTNEIELTPIVPKVVPKDVSKVVPKDVPKAAKRKSHKKKPTHIKHRTGEGVFYYEEEKTGQTSWEVPTGGDVKVVLDETLKAEKATKKEKKEKKKKKKGRSGSASSQKSTSIGKTE
jgi:hypothetical protein